VDISTILIVAFAIGIIRAILETRED